MDDARELLTQALELLADAALALGAPASEDGEIDTTALLDADDPALVGIGEAAAAVQDAIGALGTTEDAPEDEAATEDEG